MEQTGEQSSSRSDKQEYVPATEERPNRADQRERPAITVDVVIMSLLQRDLQVLLVERRSWPWEGMWAIPGGFVGRNESLEEAARRELLLA
jgi:8-oxo-dGTP diphosphatase